jgi:hypothetical protein
VPPGRSLPNCGAKGFHKALEPAHDGIPAIASYGLPQATKGVKRLAPRRVDDAGFINAEYPFQNSILVQRGWTIDLTAFFYCISPERNCRRGAGPPWRPGTASIAAARTRYFY